jgi:hypothetical protein
MRVWRSREPPEAHAHAEANDQGEDFWPGRLPCGFGDLLERAVSGAIPSQLPGHRCPAAAGAESHYAAKTQAHPESGAASACRSIT